MSKQADRIAFFMLTVYALASGTLSYDECGIALRYLDELYKRLNSMPLPRSPEEVDKIANIVADEFIGRIEADLAKLPTPPRAN